LYAVAEHLSTNPAFWVFDSLSILVSEFRNPVVQIDEFFRKSKNTHWAIFPSFLRKRDESRSTMGRKEGARERIIQCAVRKIHENLPFSLARVSTSHIPKGHASPLCLYTSLVLTQFCTEKPKTHFANWMLLGWAWRLSTLLQGCAAALLLSFRWVSLFFLSFCERACFLSHLFPWYVFSYSVCLSVRSSEFKSKCTMGVVIECRFFLSLLPFVSSNAFG
jgi:hypothetical protein